jgi:hypothetical protein
VSKKNMAKRRPVNEGISSNDFPLDALRKKSDAS